MKNEKKTQKKIKKQRKKLLFRGRFGKKSIRNISKQKWQKWRKSSGCDLQIRKENGLIPKIGYGTTKSIRFLHPSGLKETRIFNTKELEKIGKETIVRIASKVGAKKREQIIAECGKKSIRIANP